ncbi:uncharacterized protein LOC133194301 [Saccostrea echinata]|uniref:uncharacterized protein LOC133194301 n=1 Tax=Saccostrea echinata TaxID=191078 RepID=UPI002A7F68AD|nr:uncharacterized protein LOC133194301 [Saccostrea echinata]
MDTLGVSAQCKVRQCSQCQGDTEFYCNTCKHDLCLQCKERHVIDLDTIYHDVVIYREKHEYILKQETCVRHPDIIYEMFCHSCELPVCDKCKEHRNHQIQDVRTAYISNRQKHREIVHNIRSETLYNSCCVLAGIKTDLKACHKEICNRQSEMLIKAQKLRNLIYTVMCDVKIRHKRFMYTLQQQRRKINKHLASIENFEHRSDQSANRPLEFLIVLKKNRVHKIKDTPNLTQYALVCLNEEINMEDVIDLGEIQILEKGKRKVRNECLLKLMPSSKLHRSVTMTGEIYHISGVTPDQVWISDGKNLFLINKEGDILRHLTDVISVWGQHTVNLTGDLIYIDRYEKVIKLSKDNRTKSTLIKKSESWIPQCVYSSHFNGDLLVGMQSYKKGIITRYNDTGQHKQTIQHGNTGQELYSDPIYITENRNGDVIVSDIDGDHGAVVVTERGGRHRFSYTGPPSGSQLFPLGICTDGLSHILVCDGITSTVQMLDKDGLFLSLILTRQQGINGPMSLSYDDKTHLLWIGRCYGENRVCVYRYIERQDFKLAVLPNETNYIMHLRFSAQCKVQQCSQCQRDTEFYCKSCKFDLCLRCKEIHVIDLCTMYHDVVIYREKYEYIPKQDICMRHPNRVCEMFCHSCQLPVCFQCTEHRKHQILDIRSAYKANRQQYRDIIHKIRSETIYNSCFLLAGIKTDLKSCNTKISNLQSGMSTKAQRLKDLIDTVICDVKIRHKTLIHRLQQQKRNLAIIENFEDKFEQSLSRPVNFLLFLKKPRVPRMKDSPNLTQHRILSLEEINMDDVMKLLSEIKTIEIGKRQVKNESLLQMISKPMLHRSVTVKGVSSVTHISSLTPDRIWISDGRNLILTNSKGDTLHHLTDINSIWGVHTVNMTCDLIYIDSDGNINKISKDNNTKSSLIKTTNQDRPCCVYSCPSNGDLLVGKRSKVTRYNETGQHIQTIRYDNKGQQMYRWPRFMTENNNGDVIVSDLRGIVVVTERGGKHRFSYTGHPSESRLYPQGICTDALSHILVCDGYTDSVHLIDKDGNFLSLTLSLQPWVYRPHSLSYDEKSHLFLVGLWNNNRLCIFSYVERKKYIKGHSI